METMANAETVIARRHKVKALMCNDSGITMENASEHAKALGISVSTLWRDVRVIRERWPEEGEPVLPNLQEWVEHTEQLRQMAMDEGDILTAVRDHQGLPKVLCLEAPKQVNVTVSAEEQMAELPVRLLDAIQTVMRLQADGGEMSEGQRYLAGLLEDRPALGEVIEADFEEE